jgi:hypothetical protein
LASEEPKQVKKNKSIKNHTYEVTVVPITNKSKNRLRNNAFISGTQYAFAINGKLPQTLHLERKKKYKFIVKPNDIPGLENLDFFFTTDPLGGMAGQWTFPNIESPVKLPGTPDPITNGCIELDTSDPNIPSTIYYHSTLYTGVGGVITLHDMNK